MGAPSNQLLPIFGAPSDVVQDGDLEVLTYAWVIENTEGTIDRPYFSRIPEVSDRFLVRARCKVRLEVRGGLVTTAEAEGVTTRNGLYRAGCIDAFMARVKTVERAR